MPATTYATKREPGSNVSRRRRILLGTVLVQHKYKVSNRFQAPRTTNQKLASALSLTERTLGALNKTTARTTYLLRVMTSDMQVCGDRERNGSFTQCQRSSESSTCHSYYLICLPWLLSSTTARCPLPVQILSQVLSNTKRLQMLHDLAGCQRPLNRAEMRFGALCWLTEKTKHLPSKHQYMKAVSAFIQFH